MNATNRSKKANNGRNQFAKGNNATYLAKTENAAVICFPDAEFLSPEFKVIYFAQEMENCNLKTRQDAMEMFELVNMPSLAKNELKALGFHF
jgi:hypothetical protein